MSESVLDSILLPAGTVISQKGDSSAVDITGAPVQIFLLTLQIAEAVEQEYIEIELYGSSDGTAWGARPLATLPQRFYPGEYPTLVDLSAATDTKYLRARWEVSRWGRGELTPHFVGSLTLRPVPPDMLR